MGKTTRFGLNTFGGPEGGAISDDGQKFSTQDRRVIDSVLAALEDHNHEGTGQQLPAPTTGAVLALQTSGGQLGPGQTLYYRVSYVDAWGLETVASDEVYVATPDAIRSPAQPAVTVSAGGALVPGTYYYAVTFTQDGYETTPSPVALVTLPVTGTVLVDLPDVAAGATGYRVYRKAPTDFDLNRVAELPVSATMFTDDGTAVSTGAVMPVINSTNANNAVVITVPDVALVSADPSQVKGWRIYRSNQSGQYLSASLVHQVVETVNEVQPFGGLRTSWTDTGEPLLVGQPQEVNTSLKQPGKIVAELVTVAPPATVPVDWTATDVQAAIEYLLTHAGSGGGGGGGGVQTLATLPRGTNLNTYNWAGTTEPPSVSHYTPDGVDVFYGNVYHPTNLNGYRFGIGAFALSDGQRSGIVLSPTGGGTISTSSTLTFQYQLNSEQGDELVVQAKDATTSTWVELWRRSGQEGWLTKDLYVPANVTQLRMFYERDTDGSSEGYDDAVLTAIDWYTHDATAATGLVFCPQFTSLFYGDSSTGFTPPGNVTLERRLAMVENSRQSLLTTADWNGVDMPTVTTYGAGIFATVPGLSAVIDNLDITSTSTVAVHGVLRMKADTATTVQLWSSVSLQRIKADLPANTWVNVPYAGAMRSYVPVGGGAHTAFYQAETADGCTLTIDTQFSSLVVERRQQPF